RARFSQVDFADDDDIGGLESGGILEGFVLTFRDGPEDDLEILSEIVSGRANQVADILDEKQFHPVAVERLAGSCHHLGFKVAEGAGSDLHDRRPGSAQSLCVVVGSQVADDDSSFGATVQTTDGFKQESGFAGAWRREDVEDEQAAAME